MAARGWTISVEDRKRLIEGAFEAKNFSYSPYSDFPVGAALLSSDGVIIKGTNVENATYGGLGVCAETTAIVTAITEGIRSFVGLAVVTNVKDTLSPCGKCRQVLREFCPLNMPIFLVPADYPKPEEPNQESKPGYSEGGVHETTLGELLPFSFGPEHLIKKS